MKELVHLTEIEQKIFDKVKQEYSNRGITMIDEDMVRKFIKLANTEGDGKKRVSSMGNPKARLVPIEDIFLKGLKAEDLEKYPVER